MSGHDNSEPLKGEFIPASKLKSEIEVLDEISIALGMPSVEKMLEDIIDQHANENVIEGELIVQPSELPNPGVK